MNPQQPESSIRRFIATTPGLSATRWLAHVLASHRDVFVAHGHFPLDSLLTSDFQAERRSGDGESMTTGTAMADYYRESSIQQVFADYRTLKPAALAFGNIHSYTLDALTQHADGPEDLNKIRVVNILRHPVAYIDSHCSLVRSAEAHNALYRHYVQNVFRSALQDFPELFLMDCLHYREFLAFAVSCFSVFQMARDFQHAGFEHFRMESLTSEAETLKRFCETLTGFEYSLTQLHSFIDSGPINRHRKSNAITNPQAIYSAWPAWKQDMAFVMIPKLVLDQFEEEGYEIRMLRADVQTQKARNLKSRARCLADRLEAMDSQHPLLGPLKPTRDREPHANDRFTTPKIVDTYQGFNIIMFRDSAYGLRQSLGPVDLSLPTSELLNRYQRQDFLTANSADQIKKLIDSFTG